MNIIQELSELRRQQEELRNLFNKQIEPDEARSCVCCHIYFTKVLNVYGYCPDCWGELSRPKRNAIIEDGECGNDKLID